MSMLMDGLARGRKTGRNESGDFWLAHPAVPLFIKKQGKS